MKIIHEDADILIFEEKPNKKPDKKALSITITLVILFLLLGLFYYKNITLFDVLFGIVIWSVIFIMFFILGQKYTINIKIDKKANLISISGFLPPVFSWERKPIEIPMQLVKGIEYDTWEPYPFYPLNFITTLGKLVFILNDDSTVELRAFGFLVSYKIYGDIGKKIADYISVPFKM
jgi:hypothetical protein